MLHGGKIGFLIVANGGLDSETARPIKNFYIYICLYFNRYCVVCDDVAKKIFAYLK